MRTRIIINAGGYSHTSIAILDALRAADLPIDRGASVQYLSPRALSGTIPMSARRRRGDLRPGRPWLYPGARGDRPSARPPKTRRIDGVFRKTCLFERSDRRRRSGPHAWRPCCRRPGSAEIEYAVGDRRIRVARGGAGRTVGHVSMPPGACRRRPKPLPVGAGRRGQVADGRHRLSGGTSPARRRSSPSATRCARARRCSSSRR